MTEIDLEYIRKELESRLDGFTLSLLDLNNDAITCNICKLCGSVETNIREGFVGICYLPKEIILNNTWWYRDCLFLIKRKINSFEEEFGLAKNLK